MPEPLEVTQQAGCQADNFTNSGLPAGVAPSASSGYYEYARQEILALIPETASRILDVGCGAGGLGSLIKARQSAEVHGVEIVPPAAAIAETRLDRVWRGTIEGALPDLPNAYYDYIVVADVLEHLVDPWTVLDALRLKLSPQGRILASIPNIQNWGVLSALIEGAWDYRSDGLLDRTHLRFFTRKTVEELCWGAGLRIVRFDTTIRGPALPHRLLVTLRKSGLHTSPMQADGRTWQFLVVAEPPKPIAPRVTIVILNWNGYTDTIECVASVLRMAYQNFDIVVVDNGSTDESVANIRAHFPQLRILETGRNLGYAGGNNVGIDWALRHGADYVMVLNNDTTVDANCLTHLIEMANVSQAGLLGPATYFHENQNMLWAIGAQMALEPRLTYKILGERDGLAAWPKPLILDALVGSCMLIQRDVLEKIGSFSKEFFLCWEEFDLCARANAAGFKCVYVPNAAIWHKVGSTLGTAKSPLRIYFNVRNRLLWAKRNLPFRSRLALHYESLVMLRQLLWDSFHYPTGKITLKQIAWSLHTWIRSVTHPETLAALYGLRDYYFGLLNDCPARIRKLAGKNEKRTRLAPVLPEGEV